MTPEEHERDRARAIELLDTGQVRTWRELAQAFGVSPAAAHMRFGRQYGLVMPPRTPVRRRQVSVAIDEALEERLNRARDEASRICGLPVSRAQIARAVLEAHLPR